MGIRLERGVLFSTFLLILACGDAERVDLDADGGPGGGDAGAVDGGNADDPDGGEGSPDGGVGGACTPQAATCNNCEDDDGDGLIDGDDPHCSGPLDEDEGTFSTGIPGDNSDPKKQDCFFDGDSGMCQIHTCCLLPEPCDEETFGAFDPETDCEIDDGCVEDCAPLTPPGCDCFGCCTVCAPDSNECFDVLLGLSPACDVNDLASDACVKCEKSDVCEGGGCDPEACILCPGQTEDDLPPECGEMNECPGGASVCETSADCGGTSYCSTGCCVAVVD